MGYMWYINTNDNLQRDPQTNLVIFLNVLLIIHAHYYTFMESYCNGY